MIQKECLVPPYLYALNVFRTYPAYTIQRNNPFRLIHCSCVPELSIAMEEGIFTKILQIVKLCPIKTHRF